MFKREKTRTTRTPPALSSPEAITIVRAHLEPLPARVAPRPWSVNPTHCVLRTLGGCASHSERGASAIAQGVCRYRPGASVRSLLSGPQDVVGASRGRTTAESLGAASRPSARGIHSGISATTPNPAARSTPASRTPSGRFAASTPLATTRPVPKTTDEPGDSRSPPRSEPAAPPSTPAAGDRAT